MTESCNLFVIVKIILGYNLTTRILLDTMFLQQVNIIVFNVIILTCRENIVSSKILVKL